jgi:TolA-binding protein
VKTDHPQKARAFFEKGLILQRSNKIAEAVQAFANARHTASATLAAEARYREGCMHAERKDWGAALQCLQKAIEGKLDAAFAEDCRYRLAWLFFQDRRFEQCVEQCKKLEHDFPATANRENAWELQARSHECLKQWSQAGSAWKCIAERKTDRRARALVGAGNAARQGNDYTGAARYYAAVLKEAPATENAARAEIGLGHAHLAKKELQLAESAFQRALRLKKGRVIDAEAGYWLAECWLQQRRVSDAAHRFESVAKAAKGLPEAPHAWLKAGTAFDLDGQKDAADRCYRALGQGYPKHELAATAKRRLGAEK